MCVTTSRRAGAGPEGGFWDDGDGDGLSPDLALAASVIRATELPVRVMLRLNESLTTTGGEFMRLIGLAEEYVALGAARQAAATRAGTSLPEWEVRTAAVVEPDDAARDASAELRGRYGDLRGRLHG